VQRELSSECETEGLFEPTAKLKFEVYIYAKNTRDSVCFLLSVKIVFLGDFKRFFCCFWFLFLDDDDVLVFGGFEELDELVFAEELPMVVVHLHRLLALSELDADALELFF